MEQAGLTYKLKPRPDGNWSVVHTPMIDTTCADSNGVRECIPGEEEEIKVGPLQECEMFIQNSQLLQCENVAEWV
jgi:hypothetical protein